MKRFLSLLTVCAIFFCTLTVSSNAATNPVENENLITSDNRLSEIALRAAYWSDPQFQAYYADDPIGAMRLLNEIVQDYFEVLNNRTVSTLGFDDESAYLPITTVQQPNGYYCGPASALTAMSGWNGTGAVAGSTNLEKMTTLANAMGTNSTDGTYVYRLVNGLNNYVPNGTQPYKGYLGSTLTDESFFRIYVFNSLAYSRAPILHAVTDYLSYYNGHRAYHYITLSKIDYTTMQVRLNDPHNNNLYYGTHYVPISEAYNSIHSPNGRYLICYWPD